MATMLPKVNVGVNPSITTILTCRTHHVHTNYFMTRGVQWEPHSHCAAPTTYVCANASSEESPSFPGTSPQKKVLKRSSKPIINWFQRKLAGSGKGKRTENVPPRNADLGVGRNNSNSGRHMGRITSSPLPVPASLHLKQQVRPEASSLVRRKTRSISLSGDEDLRDMSQGYTEDDISSDRSSMNRDSIWSPASALEADDDASLRPIPPSGPLLRALPPHIYQIPAHSEAWRRVPNLRPC